MKKNPILYCTICLYFVFGVIDPSHAETKTIPCPPIIGERETGRFATTQVPTNKSPYQCFRNRNDAKKSGYASQKISVNKDLSGWFRIRLTKVRDRCNDTVSDTGPVLFLQVNQKDKGIFTDFCPSLGQMTGVRAGSGFTASRTATITESDSPLSCSDNLIEKTQQLTLSPVVEPGAAFNAVYEIIRRCVTGDEATKSCTIQYSGVAFYETHEIWPDVDPNINMIRASCQTALHSCVECHPNLKDIDLQP